MLTLRFHSVSDLSRISNNASVAERLRFQEIAEEKLGETLREMWISAFGGNDLKRALYGAGGADQLAIRAPAAVFNF